MLFFRRLVLLSFIFSFFIFPSIFEAEAMITINSIDEVESKVRSLRANGTKADEICVVFDFHGVIVEEAEHKKDLHLKGNILNTLEYLKTENTPYLVATAWNNFEAVIQDGSVILDLPGYFDVNLNHTAPLEDFTLGSNKIDFEGYRNGRFVALKHKVSEDIYFRQKAYSVELLYPNHNLKYIILAEDSLQNLKIFSYDANSITHTAKPSFQELILCHLKSEK